MKTAGGFFLQSPVVLDKATLRQRKRRCAKGVDIAPYELTLRQSRPAWRNVTSFGARWRNVAAAQGSLAQCHLTLRQSSPRCAKEGHVAPKQPTLRQTNPLWRKVNLRCAKAVYVAPNPGTLAQCLLTLRQRRFPGGRESCPASNPPSSGARKLTSRGSTSSACRERCRGPSERYARRWCRCARSCGLRGRLRRSCARRSCPRP